MKAQNKPIRWNHIGKGLSVCVFLALTMHASAQPAPLPARVTKLCSIQFDKDSKFAARVEDGALSCMNQAAKSLKDNPTQKLVLIGTADPSKDTRAVENGHMRETEDKTGADVRFEDLAAYRAVNTKGYLVRWLHLDPTRSYRPQRMDRWSVCKLLSCTRRCKLQQELPWNDENKRKSLFHKTLLLP